MGGSKSVPPFAVFCLPCLYWGVPWYLQTPSDLAQLKKTTLTGVRAIQSSCSIHCFVFIDSNCHYICLACLLHLAQSFRCLLQTSLKLTFTVWFLLQVLLCYCSSFLQVVDKFIDFETTSGMSLSISNVNAFPWSKYVTSNTSMLLVAHHSFHKSLPNPMWFTAVQPNRFVPVKLPRPCGWCSPLNTRERNHTAQEQSIALSHLFSIILCGQVCISANKKSWFNEI